jgi:hypothetical protein
MPIPDDPTGTDDVVTKRDFFQQKCGNDCVFPPTTPNDLSIDDLSEKELAKLFGELDEFAPTVCISSPFSDLCSMQHVPSIHIPSSNAERSLVL